MSTSIRWLMCLSLTAAGIACSSEPAASPALTANDAQTAGGDSALADGAAGDVGQAVDTAAQDAAADALGDTAADRQTPDAAATDADAGAGGTIAIYLNGDHAPKTFADGLAGQTATDFQVALSRYSALKALDDPAPQVCFDHGAKPVIADLKGDTLMGTCATAAMASGLYTHGRVKIDWSRYSVKGNLHYNGITLPGTFTFLRAWSDTTVDGKAFKAGTGTLRFQDVTGAVTNEVPYTYPPYPAIPGITMQTVAGEFLMTFAYKKGLPIVQSAPGQHWARFHWHVQDGFRWQDAADAAFTKGIWDVTPPPGTTEKVVFAGTTNYHVTSSVD